MLASHMEATGLSQYQAGPEAKVDIGEIGVFLCSRHFSLVRSGVLGKALSLELDVNCKL